MMYLLCSILTARLQLGKGPLGEKTGSNLTDRAEVGTKRHVLTDQRGTLLSAVTTRVNTHDMKTAFETLDGVVVKRPAPGCYHPQHLCLDKVYDYPEIEGGVI
jgi:putative transposase